MAEEPLDCLIVGGGPAGLTAAVYLARFHLKVRLVDAGRSRAGQIPLSRNVPGFPDGISGPDFLVRMRAHAEKAGCPIVEARVTRLDRSEDGFAAEYGAGTTQARTILLATGLRNRRPDMDEELHNEALARGMIRYCPICDGYEVSDRKVGVIGSGSHGVAEALFLRSYTKDVTLIAPDCSHDLAQADRERLDECKVVSVDGPARGVAIQGDCIVVETQGGHLAFDSVYPALGSDVHNKLALQIGVATAKSGCIKVDDHQRTDVPGIYSAGDVVLGLDQISNAVGEGGVAATTIRNDLAKSTPLWR